MSDLFSNGPSFEEIRSSGWRPDWAPLGWDRPDFWESIDSIDRQQIRRAYQDFLWDRETRERDERLLMMQQAYASTAPPLAQSHSSLWPRILTSAVGLDERVPRPPSFDDHGRGLQFVWPRDADERRLSESLYLPQPPPPPGFADLDDHQSWRSRIERAQRLQEEVEFFERARADRKVAKQQGSWASLARRVPEPIAGRELQKAMLSPSPFGKGKLNAALDALAAEYDECRGALGLVEWIRESAQAMRTNQSRYTGWSAELKQRQLARCEAAIGSGLLRLEQPAAGVPARGQCDCLGSFGGEEPDEDFHVWSTSTGSSWRASGECHASLVALTTDPGLVRRDDWAEQLIDPGSGASLIDPRTWQ